MSGMSRTERLRRILARQDCYFVGDKRSKRYHTKDCVCISQIVKKDLEACGPNPELHEFKPCPVCKPIPVIVKKERSNLKTKSELMRQAMAELAERHSMHIEFKGGSAMVTTIAGEWFFDYNQRPICLHHKNNDARFHADGTSDGYYHVQKLTFPTPLAALAYIYHHERAAERLAFESDTEKERADR
nr:hypothetical protein [uncultured Oscillibacter sp.]